MGVFSFRFLAICFACLALTTSMVVAQTLPPLVVGPTGGTGGSNTSSVCDPAIRSMLDSAGSAQAQRDIATIASVIRRPADAMDINCYCETQYKLIGKPSEECPTPPSTTTPCDGMNDAWNNALIYSNNAVRCQDISNTQEKKECLCSVYTKAEDKDLCLKGGVPATTASTGTGTPTASATFDRINLYAGATEPVSQVASKECHPGIPTGVKINGKAEIVCPNPGCAPKLSGDGYKCETY